MFTIQNAQTVSIKIPAIAVGLALASQALAADVYPSKPIRMVVPFSPGGTSDTLARILGQKLTDHWGQQIVVDFRPGASGIIGTEIAMRAAAPGISAHRAWQTLLTIAR